MMNRFIATTVNRQSTSYNLAEIMNRVRDYCMSEGFISHDRANSSNSFKSISTPSTALA